VPGGGSRVLGCSQPIEFGAPPVDGRTETTPTQQRLDLSLQFYLAGWIPGPEQVQERLLEIAPRPALPVEMLKL